MDVKPVLFSEERVGRFGAGIIELNTPRSLNALYTPAYQLIEARLRMWAEDPEIAFIILKSNSEKAFCAGGDVKSLVLDIQSQGISAAETFFTLEYFIDYWLHVFPKPVVAFMDGITMGGGIGISHGATVRVVTERSMLAMPEVTIGLFPDVGATKFLSELPDQIGLYLGLTGRRFDGTDAVAIGLADALIPSGLLRKVTADLLRQDWTDSPGENRKTLKKYFAQIERGEMRSQLVHDYDSLKRIFADAGAAVDALLKIDELFRAFISDSPGIADSQKRYLEGSPTSKAVFFEAYRRHAKLPLQEVFAREWDMALAFSRGQEFREGVRALLIDKDQKPKWEHASLSDAIADCEKYFAPSSDNLLRKKFAGMG